MTRKENIAKMIRIVTTPPILITALILILSMSRDDIFQGMGEILMSILLLGMVPVLAYPLQRILPGWKEGGREGQRNLAFVLNLAGYMSALILGYLSGAGKNLKLIDITYFLSVVILTAFNKFIHIRASGHACGVTGPLLLLLYFTGWAALIPCLAMAAAIVWSSLELKRHTIQELAYGAGTCLIAFFSARWILGI